MGVPCRKTSFLKQATRPFEHLLFVTLQEGHVEVMVKGCHRGVPLAQEDLCCALRVAADEPRLPGLPGGLGRESDGVETRPLGPPLEVLSPCLVGGERLHLKEVLQYARAAGADPDPPLLLLPLRLQQRGLGQVDERAVEPVLVLLHPLRLDVPEARQGQGVQVGLVIQLPGSLPQRIVLRGAQDPDLLLDYGLPKHLCDGQHQGKYTPCFQQNWWFLVTYRGGFSSRRAWPWPFTPQL